LHPLYPPYKSYFNTVPLSYTWKSGPVPQNLEAGVSLVNRTIEEEGPFDVVIGFSEGASVAASAIVNRALSNPLEPPDSLFKAAVFIAAWPPIDVVDQRKLTSEIVGQIIQIPTTHVIGANDPYMNEGICVRDMCNADKALTMMHKGMHEVPLDKSSGMTMAAMIMKNIQRASMPN
jgi:hypothetical protein